MKNKSHKPARFVLSCMTLSIANTVFAAGEAAPANLATITVNASPIVEETRIDAFSSVSAIVMEDQLRDQNAVDLAAAMRRTPGVQISRYNPVGAHGGDQGGAVFIRGLGISRPGSEIQTYVDGIPVYMGVWSHPLLDLLPINGMQSITVNKSPRPQLNGNNFASINLETKRAMEDGIHGDVRLSAGSYGTVIEQASLIGRSGDLDFSLAQGYASSNGHRNAADGELNNVMGRVALKLNTDWSIGASVLSMRNKSHDPGDNRLAPNPTPPEYQSNADVFSAFLKHQHGDWKGELSVYSTDGSGDLYNDLVWNTFLTRFKTGGLRWKEEFSPWSGGVVVAGVDYDRVTGDVKGPFTGGFTGAKENMPEFRLTSPHFALSQTIVLNKEWSLVPAAGVRFYNHNQYASRAAPHAGISLASEHLTIFANAARGIHYPGLENSALQAALPFMFAGTTWQQLSPEEVNHGEIGIKLTPTEATQVDLSLFHDAIKNRYVYDLSFGTTTFYNAGNYHTNGAELSVRQQLGDNWSLFAGLTLLRPSLSTLPYTPREALTFGANGQIGPLRVAIDAQSQSQVYALNRSRDTLSPNTTKVGSFTVLNTRLAYPLPTLGKKGEVFIAVENLFDRAYAYRPGYPMPGRNGQIGISTSF